MPPLLLGHTGLGFSKNRTELLQEVLLRSRCNNIIESQDHIALKRLKFLDLEEDTTTALPLMDDSREEIFGILVRGHCQGEIHNGITELLLVFLGLSQLLLLFKEIFAIA